MATNIPVQDLDFDKIKANLKEYLKGQSKFQDFDFEGSSMSILMDLLSYVTHYGGFYAHMLNNESNIDSAYLKSSMVSKAKFQNYIPGSKKSAQSIVKFIFDVDATNEPNDRKIVVPRGQTIKSNNNNSDNRTFVLVDDLYIYNNAMMNGVYDYSSDDTTIFEGTFEETSFKVDSTLVNQRFIIRDPNIDISSLRVRVYDSESTSSFVTYKLADDYMTIDSDAPVFFLAMNEEDYYEIQFGNGVYGRKVEHGNLVECTYVATSGVEGNNAKRFTMEGPFSYGGELYDVVITPLTPAEGGLDSETVDDLRFNVPYHYRRQNRAVIVDDYKNLLLSEYRNINSINVWGGEDNEPKVYGKVFICIKPKYGEVLSGKVKDSIIEKIIKRRNVTVIEAEIVDPDYIYVNLDVKVQYNPMNTTSTPGEVVTSANNAIDEYNEVVLNRFGGYYSDLELNTRVRASNPAILTSYSYITLEKRFEPSINTKQTYYVDFTNAIIPGTIKSDEFTFRLSRCYFSDDSKGNINIWFYDETNKEYRKYPAEVFGQVDYSKGIIRLNEFELNGLYGSETKLSVYAKPVEPDFFTKRNKIVVINEVNLTAKENFENENEKR